MNTFIKVASRTFGGLFWLFGGALLGWLEAAEGTQITGVDLSVVFAIEAAFLLMSFEPLWHRPLHKLAGAIEGRMIREAPRWFLMLHSCCDGLLHTIASSPRSSDEQVEFLAHHHNWRIRLAAIRSGRLSDMLLRALAVHDLHMDVRGAAAEALDQRHHGAGENGRTAAA